MKIRIGKLQASFVLIVFILFSTDSMLVSTNSNRVFARISWVLMILFLLVNIRLLKPQMKELLFLGSFSLLIVLSGLVNDGTLSVNYIQRILLLWIATIIVHSISYDDYIKQFIRVVNFIALFSLVCWLLRGVLITLPVIPTIYTGDITYKCLFFTNISTTSTRNFGPFWEPGAYQLFLNLAIFYELRDKKYFDIKSFVLLVITLLTTFSTGGIIVFFVILLYSVIAGRESRGTKHSALKILVIVLMIGGLVFLQNSNYGSNVFAKIVAYIDNPLAKNSANVSAYTRFNSFDANISMIRQRPLFGWGIQGSSDMLHNTYNLSANTNTILGMGSSYGIIAMGLYCFLFLKGAFQRSRNLVLNTIYLIIIGTMLSTESLLVSLPFFVMLFYESNMFHTVDAGTGELVAVS